MTCHEWSSSYFAVSLRLLCTSKFLLSFKEVVFVSECVPALFVCRTCATGIGKGKALANTMSGCDKTCHGMRYILPPPPLPLSYFPFINRGLNWNAMLRESMPKNMLAAAKRTDETERAALAAVSELYTQLYPSEVAPAPDPTCKYEHAMADLKSSLERGPTGNNITSTDIQCAQALAAYHEEKTKVHPI